MTSYIGIDVGKKSLHIYLPIADKSIEITNNQQGLAKLLSCCVEYYQHLSDIIIAFEPTGGYERELKEFLKLNKVNFVTVHPNKVRSYVKAKGWLAKTDLIDSKLLSEYATVFSLLFKQDYNCKSQEDLHCFIQRREQLIAFKNQEIEPDDLITEKTTKHFTLEEWKSTWMSNVGEKHTLFISVP